jgi:hypothetical protein
MSADYNTAQGQVRSRHGITKSGAALLKAWDAFVQEVEEGYEWDVSEYRNEIRVRDRIEAIASSAVLTHFAQHDDFLGELRHVDQRFRAMAHPTYRFPAAEAWWRQLVPRRAGEELVRFCRSAYGFELEVVS